jgi:hypothetical protein
MELLDIAIWASVGAAVEAFTGVGHKVLVKLGLKK